MSALLLLVATASTSTGAVACPQPVVALTAIATEGGAPRLAVVPAGSPLFGPIPRAPVTLWPLAEPLSLAEAAAGAGTLRCTPPQVVAPEAIRSPVDGTPLKGELPLYALGPQRGRTDPGPEAVQRLANLIDLRTADKEALRTLPLLQQTTVAPVPGGRALVLRLGTPPLGELYRLYGPVVALGPQAPPLAPIEAPSSAAGLRRALDDRAQTPALGETVTASAAGLGSVERTVAPPLGAPFDAGEVSERFWVAHGLALGLPLLSIGIGFIGTPRCVVMCEEQVFGFDQAYLDGFVARDADAIRSAQTRLYVLEGVTFLVAGLSMLAPSARHGYSNRLEILEDLLVLAEGSLLALSTPTLFRNRFGRNRPLTFHPVLGPEASGNDRIGPPLMAFAPALGGGLMGAATTLLFIEDAPAPFVIGTALALTGLSAVLAVTEIEAGFAFPADAPLSFVYGAINGAGVALWHQIFWRGWPGGDRGDLPLVLQGLQLQLRPDGTSLGVGGSF